MGILSTRNLNKAKSMLDKNRHKVGDLVGKATDQVDKVSKGKSSGVTAKIDDAARKFSAGATNPDGEKSDSADDSVTDDQADSTESTAPTDDPST